MRAYLLALLGGILLAVAHPKLSWSYGAFLGLALILEAQRQAPQSKGKLSFLAPWVYFTVLLYWLVPVMRNFGGLPFLAALGVLGLLAAYLSLYWVAPLMISHHLGLLRPHLLGALGFAALFTFFEYLRTIVPFAFPWGLLGSSQYREIFLIQIADWGGVFAITFLLALANYGLFALVSERRKGPFLLAILLLFGAYFYGAWRLETSFSGPSQKIGLIQGNIPQSLKWKREMIEETLAKYKGLSQKAAKEGAELLVWPETAVPAYLLQESPLFQELSAWLARLKRPLILGAPRLEERNGQLVVHNSLFLLDSRGKIRGIYDKQRLVPFGEFIPFEKELPWLRKLAVASGEYSPGPRNDPLFLAPKMIFGPLICFESIFPDLARRQVQKGASILLVATNDAWFGTTAGPYQHFVQAVFRAIENRRYLIRVANTGISGLIDPWGRILYETPLEKEAAPCVKVNHLAYFSWYTKHGDLFAWGCLLLALFLGAKSILGRRRRYEEEAS